MRTPALLLALSLTAGVLAEDTHERLGSDKPFNTGAETVSHGTHLLPEESGTMVYGPPMSIVPLGALPTASIDPNAVSLALSKLSSELSTALASLTDAGGYPPHVKRSEKPTMTPGRVDTISSGGTTNTISISKTAPPVGVMHWTDGGSATTVTIAAVAGSPFIAEIIKDGHTMEVPITTGVKAMWTSWIESWAVEPTATTAAEHVKPTTSKHIHGGHGHSKSSPQSSPKESTSHEESPSTEITTSAQALASERWISPPSKREFLDTITILDEQPGYTTLNLEDATQTVIPTTAITIATDDLGQPITVVPSTDADGTVHLHTRSRHSTDESLSGTTVGFATEKHSLIRTTDEEGSTIYVTDTGKHAKATVTSILPHSMIVSQVFNETHPLVQVPESRSIVHPQIQIPEPSSASIVTQSTTITKVITTFMTQTITETVNGAPLPTWHRCPFMHCPNDSEDPQISTMAVIGNTTIPVTKHLQLLENNRTVLVVPPRASGTFKPLSWHDDYYDGLEHLKDLPIGTLFTLYPYADWDTISKMSRSMPGPGDDDTHLKHAFIYWMREAYAYRYDAPFPPTTSGPHLVVQSAISVNGTTVRLTKPTQTVNGQVYINDPLNKYRAYDPRANTAVPTQACNVRSQVNGTEQISRNKTECAIQRCMWRFMKPIEIRTIEPAMYTPVGYHGLVKPQYVTYSTSLHFAHWGTSETRGYYYPMTGTVVTESGTHRFSMARATPSGFPSHFYNYKPGIDLNPSHIFRRNAIDHAANKVVDLAHTHGWVHDCDYFQGDPECWDVEGCHDYCTKHAKDPFFATVEMGSIIAASIVAFLLLLGCCGCLCCACRNPQSRAKSQDRFNRYVLRKDPEKTVAVIATDPATGQTVVSQPSAAPSSTAATAGSAVPLAAAAAAGAAGAEAANGDGRGTTARRAEEGRGRVNFEDGGHPGTDPAPAGPAGPVAPPGGTPVVTEVVKPAGQPAGAAEKVEVVKPVEQPAAAAAPAAVEQHAEHAEPVPVHDGAADGAYDTAIGSGSYRHRPDANSTRGRKRNKPLGVAGIF